MTELDAIRQHHAGPDHLPQPCCVTFPDGTRSACDVQKVLDIKHSLKIVNHFRVNGTPVSDHITITHHDCGRSVHGLDEALLDEAHRQHKQHCAGRPSDFPDC